MRPIKSNAFKAGKDESDASPGYASSGEGEFSRQAARGDSPALFGEGREKARGHDHNAEELIGITRTQIRAAECDLKLCARDKREKFRKMIEIKKKFIAKLQAEIIREGGAP
jgi:hypothetical protein